MAIAFDAATFLGNESSVSSLSNSHTVGSGDDRILFVQVLTTTESVTGVTYDSVSMTLVGSEYTVPTINYKVSTWMLANPNSGANTVAITTAGSTNIFASAASYDGVDSTLDGTDTGTGDTVTAVTGSITPTVDDCWVIMFGGASAHSNYDTDTARVDQVTESDNTAGYATIGDNNAAINPAASESITLGKVNTGNAFFAYRMVAIAPAAGGGGGETYVPPVIFY